jgi:uncharacterized protein (TIGR01777 family)
MRVMLTGGTGFVGRHLVRRFVRDGHEVTVVTRGASAENGGVRWLSADPRQPGVWQREVAGQDAVINLAGASIFGRWSRKTKELLRDSRLGVTRNLIEALPTNGRCALVSGSAVGYYGFRQDEEIHETAPAGDDFLARLTRDWEAEALRAESSGVRVVLARIGIVLGKNGGALRQMIRPFRLRAGGRIGSGRQWLSWIHIDDLVESIVHLVDDGDLSGPFNLAAPNPVRNREFMKILGDVLGRSAWLPAPRFAIKALLGEFGSVLLEGQRVIPARLLASGFSFRYPDLEPALRQLLRP